MFRLVLVFLPFFLSDFAFATLGEKIPSIEKDRAKVRGVIRASVSRPAYTVQEIVNEGLSIKEYVSADGTVFAISWQGIVHPDLTGLLGSYFAEFKDVHSKRVRTPGRKPAASFEGSNVIVEKAGHMSAVRGRAYVPALIPNGVSADEIQ